MQHSQPGRSADSLPSTGNPAPVIVDTSRSPYAKLRPVGLDAVTIADRFWAPRQRVNHDVTLPTQYERLEETGRIHNLRRAAGKAEGPFIGRYFNDSDVYKWLEAVAWTLGSDHDARLAELADGVIAEIAAAQQPDGYLNSYFMFEHEAERWTNFDLHEMYCAGHLFQAAVAHYRATGKTTLLDVATRLADHICDVFGPEDEGKRWGNDGHPEVELALVELYRATRNRRYLDQARYFIDARGYGRLGRPYGVYGPEYSQDHLPFRELSSVDGHAVRALYLNSGGADVLAETGDQGLGDAIERMWSNMTGQRSYLSGGVGSRYEGEAMGKDYELPNERAYTETCAAIASLMWAWRMLATTGDAQYADVFEHTLYNAVLPGISLVGDTYFYQNPLADDGTHRRQAWFGTACCPPNVARMLASLGGYLYGVGDDGIWVHQYIAGAAHIETAGGTTVTLRQQANYPWSGEIEIAVDGSGEWSLHLRIPGWCESGAAILVNDQPWQGDIRPGTYAELRRQWSPGDRLTLRLPMPVRRVECHPFVAENAGRVALLRGPLLYCLEGVDYAVDVREVALPMGAELRVAERADLLGGVVVVQGTAEHVAPGAGWKQRLYRSVDASATDGRRATVELLAVPYFAWANRDAGRLQVWLPVA